MGCFNEFKKLVEEIEKNSPMKICVNEEQLAAVKKACAAIDSIYSNDCDLSRDGIKVFEDEEGVFDVAICFPTFYMAVSNEDRDFITICEASKRMSFDGSKENGVYTTVVFGDLFKKVKE